MTTKSPRKISPDNNNTNPSLIVSTSPYFPYGASNSTPRRLGGTSGIPLYMRQKSQNIEQLNGGLVNSWDEKSSLALPSSSPPPESSSPFPGSSPPEHSSSPVCYLDMLPTIYEEDLSVDPSILDSAYECSSKSPGSDVTSSDNGSSHSSTTSDISGPGSDTSPSLMDAHTTWFLRDMNDDFSNQLHERLLAVVEERKSTQLERKAHVITESSVITKSELISMTDKAENLSWAGQHTAPPSRKQTVGSRTSSGRSSSRSSSSQARKVDPAPFTDNHYDLSGSNSQTDKLRFASPSPLPSRIYVPKRPRSPSPPNTQLLKRQFRHRKTSPLCIEGGTPTHKAPAPTFRIIKRASSFLAGCSKITEDPEEPPSKRNKTNSNHGLRRIGFVKGPASLRRALSLRSEPSANEIQTHTPPSGLVPTAPCTPPELSPVVHHSPTRRRFRREQKVKYPHPITLPPIDYVARLPISTETSAKMRLQRLIEREKIERQQDGLWAVNLEHGSRSTTVDESRLTRSVSNCESDGRSDVRCLWESVLDIGCMLRDDIMDWILNVLPEPIATPRTSSASSSSCSSCSSTNSSTSTIGFTDSNLFDQLATSPETRFHAAYMFLRYFYLVRAAPGSPPLKSGKADDLYEDGFELATWDVAVGCLSLSVKYHRDFLEPLLPVYAHEFQELSPYHTSYEDLEASQRDLLSAFSYRLGMTPQGVLDELWLALPSLRQLFNFNGGWNCVLKETWWKLFEAISEPDVLQFPVSLLTASALSGAIIESLMLKYEYDAGWEVEVTRRRKPGYVSAYAATSALQLRRKRERRAENEAEGVIQDIQAALDITNERLKECRQWLLTIPK